VLQNVALKMQVMYYVKNKKALHDIMTCQIKCTHLLEAGIF